MSYFCKHYSQHMNVYHIRQMLALIRSENDHCILPQVRHVECVSQNTSATFLCVIYVIESTELEK